MSAPKPELTAELRAVINKYPRAWNMENLVREVVEIVAKIDADEAYDVGLQTDDPAVIRRAILTHWGLK